jgi:hypothetical protein
VPIVDAAARTRGIGAVYHFDPRLGGADGADITALLTLPGMSATLYAPTLWLALTTAYLTNLDPGYTSADTALLVVDKSVTSAPVIAQAVLHASDTPEAIKTAVTAALDAAGLTADPNPPATASHISEFAYAQAKFGAVLGRPRIPDALAEDFTVKQVTLPELLAVLDTPGEHNVLVSGTWCADSKEAIGNVITAAQTHAAGEPLWWFDFQFDGVHDGFSALGSDGPGAAGGLAYLGARLLDGYLTGLHAHFAGGPLRYYPDGDPAQPLATTSVPRFRSPALFRVASGGGVERQWIRQLTAQDVLDARWGDPTGPWDGHEGDYVEYEYASGGLTPAIRTAGWLELATFFDPAYPSGPSATPTDDAGPSSSAPATPTGGPGVPADTGGSDPSGRADDGQRSGADSGTSQDLPDGAPDSPGGADAAPGTLEPPAGSSEGTAQPPAQTGTRGGAAHLARVRAPVAGVRVVAGTSVTIPIVGDAAPGSTAAGATASTDAASSGSASSGTAKAAVTWTSSKPKVASIAIGKKSGIVRVPVGGAAKVAIKALTKGATTLTLRTAEGKSLRLKVTVVGAKVAPERLSIGPKTVRLKAGRTAVLTAKPANRQATGIVPRWTSSNPKVAVVDAAGRVTARAKGRTTITVRAGGLTARRTVRVT